jgi:hypothetical protein
MKLAPCDASSISMHISIDPFLRFRKLMQNGIDVTGSARVFR